jgi:hypothetical protein
MFMTVIRQGIFINRFLFTNGISLQLRCSQCQTLALDQGVNSNLFNNLHII